MARIAVNHAPEPPTTLTSPFMDRLTHAVIKETSKSLKHYIDVKRRENGFILNPNSSALDAVPTRARFMYGTTKEYPPLYASRHSDNDVKNCLRSIQQYQRQPYPVSNNLEKQICREELNFHMRPPRFSPRESQDFQRLRLRPPRRSRSSCSGIHSRAQGSELFQSAGHHQDQLIDDTAKILATMVQARRSIFHANLLTRQTPATYVSQNANPSPRQADEQSNRPSAVLPPTDSSAYPRRSSNTGKTPKAKRITENVLARAEYIMQKAKPIGESFLCDYKVSVSTGNCNGASTNAPIRIKLYGTRGYTALFPLTESETHRVPFLKDQTDQFVVRTEHVGHLVGITIGHDQRDARAGWFLSNVTIEDPIRERTYEIPCNVWLSSRSNDQKTMRDFQVTSVVSHKTGSSSNGFREDLGSQSGYSTATTDGTISSTSTNRSQNRYSNQTKRPKKHHQRRPRSINGHSRADPPARPSTAAVSAGRPHPQARSPIISRSSSSSSDTTIADKVAHRPRTPSPPPLSPAAAASSPPPTRRRSVVLRTSEPSVTSDDTPRVSSPTDFDRPPARLEKRAPSPPSTRFERAPRTPPAEDEYDEDFFGN